MAVVFVCGALFALTLVGVARWRDEVFAAPAAPEAEDGPRARARHYLWWLQVAVATALLCGLLVMGVGGRLAMRLLGATAGDAAQGRITEANEVVGEITVGGTIGFVIFIGLLSGLVMTTLWFAVRRCLPERWIGGLLFGAGLLVVFGTRMEPLRPGNEDFDLVGPWWLAVAAFSALALAFGVSLAAVSARLSRWLPLIGRDRRSLAYGSLLVLVVLFPFGIAALVGGVAYVYGGRVVERVRSLLTGPTALRVAHLAIGAVVLVAAPGFVLAIGDLVGRGP
ncbi:MAG TPA: hypothetical protein VLR27_17865 [Acidimicrobiales bacterium]|nr:hypothetical protein [Acidimicrobiales bacterium]